MSQDRPTGTRILVTVAIVVVAAALLLLAAWAVIGWLAPKPAGVLRRSVPPVATALTAPGASASTTRDASLATTPSAATTSLPRVAAQVAKDVSATRVIVIDAGHGGAPDSRQEPIGPRAKQMRPREPGGTSGVVTHVPESRLNLDVALRLRAELERRGFTVIMVRTAQNVDISPRERAEVANKAKAGLLIRIHADGSTDRSQRGLKTLVPGRNEWTGPIYAKSLRAGTLAQKALIRATGATDLGVQKRVDLGGFNWSKVPTYLVEMGFMSNPAEDRLMVTDAYQAKIAKALARAAEQYFGQ